MLISRSSIPSSLQPDIRGRITTLVEEVSYDFLGGKIPFQVCNQASSDLTVTITNQSGEEISDVVLPSGRWFEAAIFGIKADATKPSVNLLIGW